MTIRERKHLLWFAIAMALVSLSCSSRYEPRDDKGPCVRSCVSSRLSTLAKIDGETPHPEVVRLLIENCEETVVRCCDYWDGTTWRWPVECRPEMPSLDEVGESDSK